MFRVLLFFLFISFGLTVIFLILDYMLGHRLLIPIAKMLKFKTDDLEKTEKKVSEIFRGDDGKKKTNRRKKA